MKRFLSMLVIPFLTISLMTSVQAISPNAESIIDGDNDIPSKNVIESTEEFEIEVRDQFAHYCTIPVPVCTQERNYWCGPATVQQILKYNNGDNCQLSQLQIAKGIGTTTDGSSLEPMLPYIRNNSPHGFIGYKIYKDPSITKMRYLIGATVFFDSGAPICRIVFKRGGNWPYSTRGHFLNVSGYDYGEINNASSSKNLVRLTDPNIQNVDPTSDGTYWVQLSELHIATTTARSQEFAAVDTP